MTPSHPETAPHLSVAVTHYPAIWWAWLILPAALIALSVWAYTEAKYRIANAPYPAPGTPPYSEIDRGIPRYFAGRGATALVIASILTFRTMGGVFPGTTAVDLVSVRAAIENAYDVHVQDVTQEHFSTRVRFEAVDALGNPLHGCRLTPDSAAISRISGVGAVDADVTCSGVTLHRK